MVPFYYVSANVVYQGTQEITKMIKVPNYQRLATILEVQEWGRPCNERRYHVDALTTGNE